MDVSEIRSRSNPRKKWRSHGRFDHIISIGPLRIPKGIIEIDLTPQASAANEAWEEAGLRRTGMDEPIGEYQYEKWGGVCEVAVYAIRVEVVLDDYPEKDVCRRKIVSLTGAGSLVATEDVSTILDRLS